MRTVHSTHVLPRKGEIDVFADSYTDMNKNLVGTFCQELESSWRVGDLGWSSLRSTVDVGVAEPTICAKTVPSLAISAPRCGTPMNIMPNTASSRESSCSFASRMAFGSSQCELSMIY
jgi:hypothetical protein